MLAAVSVDSKWTCGDSKEVVEALAEGGEEIIATGTVDDVFIMTFWASRTTKEWTLVLTSEKNREISCVVVYGSRLKVVPSTRMSV